MTSNRVSVTLSASDKEAVMTAIETIKTTLPFLISLTPDERKALPKTGDRARGFILNDTYTTANCEAYTAALRVYDYAKANAALPGMKTVVEQLKQQFARRTKKALPVSTPDDMTPAIA